jgi:hypothetical protein
MSDWRKVRRCMAETDCIALTPPGGVDGNRRSMTTTEWHAACGGLWSNHTELFFETLRFRELRWFQVRDLVTTLSFIDPHPTFYARVIPCRFSVDWDKIGGATIDP